MILMLEIFSFNNYSLHKSNPVLIEDFKREAYIVRLVKKSAKFDLKSKELRNKFRAMGRDASFYELILNNKLKTVEDYINYISHN